MSDENMKGVRDWADDCRAQAKKDDHEAAHMAEKEAWQLALHAIAMGAPNASDLAAAALATVAIDFERWFA